MYQQEFSSNIKPTNVKVTSSGTNLYQSQLTDSIRSRVYKLEHTSSKKTKSIMMTNSSQLAMWQDTSIQGHHHKSRSEFIQARTSQQSHNQTRYTSNYSSNLWLQQATSPSLTKTRYYPGMTNDTRCTDYRVKQNLSSNLRQKNKIINLQNSSQTYFRQLPKNQRKIEEIYREQKAQEFLSSNRMARILFQKRENKNNSINQSSLQLYQSPQTGNQTGSQTMKLSKLNKLSNINILKEGFQITDHSASFQKEEKPLLLPLPPISGQYSIPDQNSFYTQNSPKINSRKFKTTHSSIGHSLRQSNMSVNILTEDQKNSGLKQKMLNQFWDMEFKNSSQRNGQLEELKVPDGAKTCTRNSIIINSLETQNKHGNKPTLPNSPLLITEKKSGKTLDIKMNVELQKKLIIETSENSLVKTDHRLVPIEQKRPNTLQIKKNNIDSKHGNLGLRIQKQSPIRTSIDYSDEISPSPEISKQRQSLEFENLLQKSMQNFSNNLTSKRLQMNKSIERDEYLKKVMEDPSKAVNFEEDVIEENISLLFFNNEAHANIEQSYKNRELLKIKNKTFEMLNSLKEQSEVSRKVQMGQLRQQAAGYFTRILLNDRAEYLIGIYITNLKKKVLERQEDTLRQKNAQIVEAIMKKQGFNASFKDANTSKGKSPKKKVEKIKALPQMKMTSGKRRIASQGKTDMIPFNVSKEDPNQNLNFAMITEDQNEQEEDTPLHSIQQIEIEGEEDSPSPNKASQTGGSQDSDSDNEGDTNLQFQASEAVVEYIQNATAKGMQPLPILDKISPEGQLLLIGYKFNSGNAASFSEVLKLLIPNSLKKLYLKDNLLKDKDVSIIFKSMAESKQKGLTSFTIIENQIGQLALEGLAFDFFESYAARGLSKLQIKNPFIVNKNMDISIVFSSMERNIKNLKNLRTLQISQMKLNRECIPPMIEVVKNLNSLMALDLSSTGLAGADIEMMLKALTQFSTLKSLNLAFNSIRMKGQFGGALKINQVVKSIAQFIHYQDSLLHIDLGGLEFAFQDIEHLFKCGLAKSRTLRSCHLIGVNNFGAQKYNTLVKILKVRDVYKDDFGAKLDRQMLKDIFEKHKSVEDSGQFFASNLNKTKEKLKAKAKAAVKAPLFPVSQEERHVFTRQLGFPEIIHANRWEDTIECRCSICNKYCYTTIIWNKEVQMDAEARMAHWKQSLARPVQFTNLQGATPILVVNGKMIKMIPIREFMERLDTAKNDRRLFFRTSNNEFDSDQYGKLKKKLEIEIKEKRLYHPTFWKESNEIFGHPTPQELERKEEEQYPSQTLPYPKGMLKWEETLIKLLPNGAYQAIDIKQYGILMRQTYETLIPYPRGKLRAIDPKDVIKDNHNCDVRRIVEQGEDTFCASVFLPCHHDLATNQNTSGHKVEIVVAHPQMENIDIKVIKQIPKLPEHKHLGLRQMKVHYKRLKKVKMVRNFKKSTSVFHDWKEDSQASRDKAFLIDAQFIKISGFVKDKDDIAATLDVLREYFEPLKNQFLTQCSIPKFYPVITWLEFSKGCKKWQIFDKYLTSSDIDRLFVAVNYEEEDLDNNDDNSLCRYEFSEIAARIGKERYFDKGLTDTIAEGTRRFIEEHLIPNSCEVMPWRGFRESRLYILEVDDVFKANKRAIDFLYNLTMTGPHTKDIKVLNMQDAVWLVKSAGWEGDENVRIIGASYSLSKMTIIDDMEDFDKYNDMKKCEFYEFIGRLAELLFESEEDDDVPLFKKIGRLLTILFEKHTNFQFVMPKDDNELETESDDEDELVEQAKIEIITKEFQDKDFWHKVL